jgi:ubiquinone/menaquinone biosynthesis C-methylase UbiE
MRGDITTPTQHTLCRTSKCQARTPNLSLIPCIQFRASKPEHDRLETQADQLAKLMNNQIIHAPLAAPSIHKVLDMGCGTGIVTHTIASKFPNAQVYGLDLSPVPNIRAKLPNIGYIQGDFNKLANSDARFALESFDYIFSRLLIGGMTDWKGYVERCVALTKPGVCYILLNLPVQSSFN